VNAFVTRLYDKCLGRTPDAAGQEAWVNSLMSGATTGASVGYGFVFSQEYTKKNVSDEDYVEMLYSVFLNRGSDAEGKNSWVSLLQQGLSREYVFYGFVASTEYSKLCETYGIVTGSYTPTQARDQNVGTTQFVCRLYTIALGRNYEVSGLNSWCAEINSRRCTPEVAAEGFINSTEFKNKNLSNVEYVKVLYRTFLNREYDQEGLNAWVKQLNEGTSREEVLHGFSRSPEFRKLMAQYGL
jgi:hypothetical protein